jgi:hypothetical protein
MAPGQAPVYKVSGATDPNGLTIDLAKAVGIYDPSVAIKVSVGYGGIPVQWYEYVTDSGTISVTASENGATSWYFSSPSPVSSSDALNVNTVTKNELARWSNAVIDGFRLDMTFGDANYSIYGDQGSVNYPVLVDGVTTDISVSLSFDSNGTLLWANGSVATFDRVGTYPLISERDGVDNLASDTPVIGIDRIAGGVASSSAVPLPGGSDLSSDAVAAPPVIQVLITAAAIQLCTQQMTDGSVWLIPTYMYSGTATNPDGTTMESTWSTIAVDPTYLKISVRPSPIVY